MSSRKECICLKQKDIFGIWKQFKFTYVTSYFWICKLVRFLSVPSRKANQSKSEQGKPRGALKQLRHSSSVGWSNLLLKGFSSLPHRCWSHSVTPSHPHPPCPELVHPLSKVMVCQSNTRPKGQLEGVMLVARFFAGCWYSKHSSASF